MMRCELEGKEKPELSCKINKIFFMSGIFSDWFSQDALGGLYANFSDAIDFTVVSIALLYVFSDAGV